MVQSKQELRHIVNGIFDGREITNVAEWSMRLSLAVDMINRLMNSTFAYKVMVEDVVFSVNLREVARVKRADVGRYIDDVIDLLIMSDEMYNDIKPTEQNEARRELICEIMENHDNLHVFQDIVDYSLSREY